MILFQSWLFSNMFYYADIFWVGASEVLWLVMGRVWKKSGSGISAIRIFGFSLHKKSRVQAGTGIETLGMGYVSVYHREKCFK